MTITTSLSEDFISAAAAAALAGKSVPWVQRRRREGHLTAYREGKYVYFSKAAVLALIEPKPETCARAARAPRR